MTIWQKAHVIYHQKNLEHAPLNQFSVNMLRKINDTVLMDGIIKKIIYSRTKDFIRIEFKNSAMLFEFRNGKKNRADTVKKMKLESGEHVICIGAISDVNKNHVFGWDIKREGFINSGDVSFVKGHIDHVMKIGNKNMVYLKNGEKTMPLLINNSKFDLHDGKNMTAICGSHLYNICNNTCKEWNGNKCECCRKKKTEKRYIAVEIGG